MASDLEQRLFEQIVEAGLPWPNIQARFAPPRMWRWDLSWDALKLAVEVDGGTQTRPQKFNNRWYQLVSGHNSTAGIEKQCEKLNEATIQGWRYIRVTKAMIEDKRALTYIKRAFQAYATEKTNESG